MLLTSFDPMGAEFDRLVQRAFGPADLARPAMRMDGIRHEDSIELRFDLPGIDPGSIDVTVDRGLLTVRAKRSEEHAEGAKLFIRERAMGSFTRRVRLSDAVDPDKIEAGYDRGILTVRIPLAEQALPRKVQVTTPATAEITA
ncbi:MAG: Hsp20/alpha crystallin family protein [Streptosporangiaceae bacterium]